MQEMLKRCSTFLRGEEVRDLLPFPLSPEPTKAEIELSMTCARAEPVSPELTHEAAVEVWMFLLEMSLNWQFEGRKVKDAGASPRLPCPRRPTAAQEAALHQLKHYVDDFGYHCNLGTDCPSLAACRLDGSSASH